MVWTAYKARGYTNIEYAPPDPEATTPLLSSYGSGGGGSGGLNGNSGLGGGRSASSASLGGGLHRTASLQFLDKAAEVHGTGAWVFGGW